MTTTGTHSGPNASATTPDGDGARALNADRQLDSQIDSLLADAAPQDAEAAPESAAQQAQDAVASIEKQVESLVEQFVEHDAPAEPSASSTATHAASPGAESSAPLIAQDAETAPASPAAHGPAPAESIGELDDQLARLTDELLIAPASETSPPIAPAAPPSTSDVVEAPQPTPIEIPAVPAAPVAPAAESPKSNATPLPATAQAGPSAFVRMFAKPLAGKPRLVRDTVGWLGFNSMFLAAVVWCYHLWFQKPEKPTPQHAPAALVSSDHAEQPHGESHGQTRATSDDHDPHAEPGHETPAHASTDPHGEHADEEPITGVSPLHKKKPTYALSNAMAEKLNVAKKSDGGHGAEKKSGSGHGAPPKSGH